MTKFFGDKCCKSIFGHIFIYMQNDKENVFFIAAANEQQQATISIICLNVFKIPPIIEEKLFTLRVCVVNARLFIYLFIYFLFFSIFTL
uniref:Uncharacterized protein n=1 Tax=Glossina palpalis gambiensis TaxID=67801 RepID=A0A1B0AYY0_9MUSC